MFWDIESVVNLITIFCSKFTESFCKIGWFNTRRFFFYFQKIKLKVKKIYSKNVLYNMGLVDFKISLSS